MSKLVSENYQDEISQGTIKRQLMISEGKEKGLENHEIFQHETSFIPTKHTPILNLLYFMFRENERPKSEEQESLEKMTQQYIKEYGYEEFITKLSKNEQFTKEVYSEELEDILSDDTEEPDSQDTFIYGEMSSKQFQTIKKLKALSKSSNEQEVFSAYKKCLELCKKFNLEFDKIPCQVK